MKEDKNTHICRQRSDQEIEDWIAALMHTYMHEKEFKKIQFRCPKTPWFNVGSLHVWDFTNNDYRIVSPRQYIISLQDGIPKIEETSDCWSSSDYGTDDSGKEYFLMQEVPH